MFILVRKDNSMIVGSSKKPVSETDKINIYEINDLEFDVNMIGSILEEFEECNEL